VSVATLKIFDALKLAALRSSETSVPTYMLCAGYSGTNCTILMFLIYLTLIKYGTFIFQLQKATTVGRAVAGVAGSNPVEVMNVCLLRLYVVLFCVCRGLCDGLITRPEESYPVSSCVWLRNQEKYKEAKAHIGL
jgi:hypothetical protein